MATKINGPGLSPAEADIGAESKQGKNEEEGKDKVEEGDVALRRNSQIIRESRGKQRTPTTVVSEAFAFLSHNPSACIEDVDEAELGDGFIDHTYSNLASGGKQSPGLDIGDTPFNGLCSGKERDRFLAGFQSKDSGFASLERQICDDGPSSLYESFMETEDENEDSVEPIKESDAYQNSVAGTGGGDSSLGLVGRDDDSVYDDVNVSALLSRDEQIANSPGADTERENVIVTGYENCGAVTINKSSDLALAQVIARDMDTTDDKCQNSLANTERAGVASQKGISIISIGSKEKSPAHVAEYENVGTKQISSDSFQAGGKEIPTGDMNKVSDGDSHQQKSEKPTVHIGQDNENMYDKVIKIDLGNYRPGKPLQNEDIAKDNCQDGFDSHCDSVLSGAITTIEIGGGGSQTKEKLNLDETAMSGIYDNIPSENSAALLASVSSDDNDDDHVENDLPPDMGETASGGEQTYDTIEMDEGMKDLSKDVATKNIFNTPRSPSSASSQKDVESKQAEDSPGKVVRRPKLEKNPSAEMGSDDSSDEDVGIYAESFRRSNWIRVSQEGKLELTMPSSSSRSSGSSPLLMSSASMSSNFDGSINETGDDDVSFSPRVDEVFTNPLSQEVSKVRGMHKRSDSSATTDSEREFKNEYITRRKCLIQRADSQQEYHRLSSRVYDQDKQVVVERISGCEDLGLHLLDSHPAFITSVDPGSAADKAGITEGQILVSVNDQNVLTTDHTDIVKLIQNYKGSVKLGVANSDFQPVRDLQAAVMSGYMYKLGNSSFMKIWKKRYFVLRQDNCLYYYKNEQEVDPLGALPLCGYTISRHTETSKDYCFKAEKYMARTYYFMTDNRDQLTNWVGALTEAAVRSKKRKESFLSVSSHNVGLPALDIRKPECTGFLGKLSPSKRAWCRRYCVLKDACVYYYKDVNSLSALGVIHLHGYTVDVENYSRRKFSFSLQPPEKKMRVFSFSADNETDKKRWVESLIHSIQRWVRVDKEAEC